jgi:hypothetical protein
MKILGITLMTFLLIYVYADIQGIDLIKELIEFTKKLRRKNV